MELDELKHRWKTTPINSNDNKPDIMEMIHHRSNGPLAGLKQSYRRQMAVMIVLPIVLITTNLNHIEATLSSILFWTYVAFCAAVAVFAAYNANIIRQLENQQQMVKQHLERTVNMLESGMRRNVLGARVALIVFIILTELLPYIQHFTMLDAWHNLPAVIRFSAYLVLVVLQQFSLKRMSYIKFGRHIHKLRDLVNEMK